MSDDAFPIPSKLNLALACVQLVLLLLILWCASWAQWWFLLPLAVGYGLVMN